MRGLTKGTAMICQHTNDYVQQKKIKKKRKVERKEKKNSRKGPPLKGGGEGERGGALSLSLTDNVEKSSRRRR